MPTGWRSVYLASHQLSRCPAVAVGLFLLDRIPAGDLEGGAEDLRTHELRHLAGLLALSHLVDRSV